jgi:hypothetical protein
VSDIVEPWGTSTAVARKWIEVGRQEAADVIAALRSRVAELEAALREIVEADKVHGSTRGVLVGPAHEIARRALDAVNAP